MKEWLIMDNNDLWYYDKLILSKKLNYICGPIGIDVPEKNKYIVRPVTNLLGLGFGTKKLYIESSTDHLTPGHFWCEFFEGNHVSIDYHYGKQILAVQGFKNNNTFIKWKSWKKVDVQKPFPEILESIRMKYKYVNCEFIGNKLIEIHFRRNGDFDKEYDEFIPVWKGQSIIAPCGYHYIECKELHNRIGAFVKL